MIEVRFNGANHPRTLVHCDDPKMADAICLGLARSSRGETQVCLTLVRPGDKPSEPFAVRLMDASARRIATGLIELAGRLERGDLLPGMEGGAL